MLLAWLPQEQVHEPRDGEAGRQNKHRRGEAAAARISQCADHVGPAEAAEAAHHLHQRKA